jgi:predicted ATPase
VLETHSEYLIRKLQLLVARKKANTDDISITYISDPNPKKRGENEPQIKHIKIKKNGGLSGRFGTGFFDEAILLSTELLKK